MKVTVLGTHEQSRLGGATHQVIITHKDLNEAAADTAQVLEVLNVANGNLGMCVCAQLIKAFEDTSDAAFNTTTITSGDGSDADRYLLSMQLNANGTQINAKAGAAGFFAYVGDDTVDVTINAMAAKSLSDIDAGECHLYYAVVTPDRAPTT